jgi:methylmalonyl-CoA epimerase
VGGARFYWGFEQNMLIAFNSFLYRCEVCFEESLGLNVEREETLGEMKIAFVPVGEVNIELIQSTTEDGVIAKFIAKRGEGVHHIAYEVEDVSSALEELKARGVNCLCPS